MITLLTIVGLTTLYSMYKIAVNIYRADDCSMFESLIGSLGWAFLMVGSVVYICYLIIKYLS